MQSTLIFAFKSYMITISSIELLLNDQPDANSTSNIKIIRRTNNIKSARAGQFWHRWPL